MSFQCLDNSTKTDEIKESNVSENQNFYKMFR